MLEINGINVFYGAIHALKTCLFKRNPENCYADRGYRAEVNHTENYFRAAPGKRNHYL